jgi:hypothetical protein
MNILDIKFFVNSFIRNDSALSDQLMVDNFFSSL